MPCGVLSPEELKKATDEAISVYNATPHESLQNVSPNDVYAGRKEVILEKRREKERPVDGIFLQW